MRLKVKVIISYLFIRMYLILDGRIGLGLLLEEEGMCVIFGGIGNNKKIVL